MTTYFLINKDGSFNQFNHFADLYNAFLKEYGYPTLGAKAIEGEAGNQLFYW
jgi:hypothetical protein